jgi:hypothetical protein
MEKSKTVPISGRVTYRSPPASWMASGTCYRKGGKEAILRTTGVMFQEELCDFEGAARLTRNDTHGLMQVVSPMLHFISSKKRLHGRHSEKLPISPIDTSIKTISAS